MIPAEIPATGPFPRAARIRRSRDFQELSRRAQRRSSEAFVLLIAPATREATGRLGLTVSRKVGNAVVRNSVKRRIREWYRRVGRTALDGRDVVVIARAKASGLSGNEISGVLQRLVGSLR